MRRLSLWIAPSIAAASLLLTGASILQNPTYDILIRRGTIVDGSGSAPISNDVAVKDGRIVAIGRFPRATAREVIDAAGLMVAPLSPATAADPRSISLKPLRRFVEPASRSITRR
jgi:N-acyl-D-amino-acid deacylase